MGNDRRSEEQEYRGPTRNRDVVFLSRSSVEEPLVEIVDQIGRAPVELRADGGHIGRREAGHHEAAPRSGQEIHERLHVSGLVIVGRADSGGIEQDRAKSGDDPRPWPDRVVRDVEEESRQNTVSFCFRGKDSLRDVAATTRLGAGIPRRPPLHRQEDGQGQERHPRISLDASRSDFHRKH